MHTWSDQIGVEGSRPQRAERLPARERSLLSSTDIAPTETLCPLTFAIRQYACISCDRSKLQAMDYSLL